MQGTTNGFETEIFQICISITFLVYFIMHLNIKNNILVLGVNESRKQRI